MIAWDAVAGRKWSIPETFPVYGGVLATAGNLVFYGTADGFFKAVNATTGGNALFQTHNFGQVSNAWQIRGTGEFDLV